MINALEKIKNLCRQIERIMGENPGLLTINISVHSDNYIQVFDGMDLLYKINGKLFTEEENDHYRYYKILDGIKVLTIVDKEVANDKTKAACGV